MSIKSVSIRIEEEMLNKIAYIADYEGRSVNSQVLVLIRENIKAFEEANGVIEGNINPDVNVKPTRKQYNQKEGRVIKTEFADKYITLGLKIAYYRKKAGYTQETFAELIDKSVNFVGQVEGTGTIRGVSLETLFKMAEVLNVSPAKLLEED